MADDELVALLALRRGKIDAERRRALLARCAQAPGTAPRQLVALGLAKAEAVALRDKAQRIEARAARILGTDPLSDRTEQAARQALRAGLLQHEQLRLALVDEAVRGGGDRLATLVQQHLGAAATVAAPHRAPGPTATLLPPVAPDAPRIGRYPVTGKLGSGGMGDVLAVLDESMGREVAAKLIRGHADEVAVRKFVLEARVTGQLEHPSIVPAYELGRTEDGNLFLTMKKVVGQELAGLIEDVRRERRAQALAAGSSGVHRRSSRRAKAQGRRSRRSSQVSDAAAESASAGGRGGLPHGLLKLLQVFLKVCEGVAFAHSKGVIHRDLKPANIMVGDYGEVLVMDWGLAKVLGQEIDADPGKAGLLPDLSLSREEALKTLDGQIIGTPAYMPPEQAEGKIELLDQRADVYALGAILYELLTLGPPYEGGNAWLVLQQVTLKAPVAPSERVEGAWAVPWELEGVVQRAMARRRGERYPDVPSLAADVEAFLAGRTVSAVEYTRWQLLSRFARRHWRSLSAAAVVLVAVIAALSYGYIRERQERSKTEAKEREAQRERAKAVDKEREALANLGKAKQLGALKSVEDLRRRFERTLHWTPLAYEDESDDLQGGLAEPPTWERLGAARRLIEAWQAEVTTLLSRREEFRAAQAAVPAPEAAPSEEERRWRELQRDSYAQILSGIVALEGMQAEVRKRAEALVRRQRRRVDEAAWAQAKVRIARNPEYRHGLRVEQEGELQPQVGLVPLGPDPGSGLEEFAHIGSGTLVRRGGDGKLILAEDSGIVFVLIPAGRYRIGSEDRELLRWSPGSRPRHEVVLDAFLLAKHELTQAQWVALGGTNESHWRAGKTPRVTRRHPVESVSWTSCVQRLGRHGLVLPTERQWEAAARGGTETPWWTGASPASLADAENVADATAQRIVRGIEAA